MGSRLNSKFTRLTLDPIRSPNHDGLQATLDFNAQIKALGVYQTGADGEL